MAFFHPCKINFSGVHRYFLVLLRWLTLAGWLAGLASPALAAPQYTANTDGTVTDATTGLTWKRCAEGQTWNAATSHCTGAAVASTWANAKALTATFAGQSDWRLPNIRELMTLVDTSVANPAIDASVFPDVPASVGNSGFWSGSPVTGTGSGWFVNFNIGISNGGSPGATLYVRLVRGGQALGLLDTARPDTDYVDQGDGTVLHTPTGLTWQRCPVGRSWINGVCSGNLIARTWAQAKLETSNFARQSDWRLPNAEELASLVDYNRSSPTINPVMFPQLPSGINLPFWSDTPYSITSSGQAAWLVGLSDGRSATNATSSAVYLWLVRGGRSVGPNTLTVSKTGTGQVATSVLPGIECGAVCQSGYAAGALVTLQASPAANLVSWGGACASAGAAATCTVTMDAAKSVTASFKDSPLLAGLATELVFYSDNIRAVGTAQSMTLRNTGTAALTNIGLSVPGGEFAQTNTCTSSLAAGASCSISVTFVPTVAGSQTGSLMLNSDAPGGPKSVSLSGTLAATVPDAPTDISAVAGNAQASVSFIEPVVTGGSTITKYTVTASPGGRNATAVSSPITVTGLTNDLSYTFTVQAINSAGNGAASAASNSVVPLRDSQSISFGAAPTLLYGGTATVSASGGASGNAVTFSSNTPTICTVLGNRVTAISVGDCVVLADQALSPLYSAAPQVSQTITVGQALQSISFGSAPALKLLGTGQLVATGGQSGNAIVFSSTTPTVCTVTGNMVTGLHAGDCVVAANQASSTNYSAAAQATQTIVISPAAQTISFGTAPVLVVDRTGVVTATGGASGNAVVFSSTTPYICTLTDSTVYAVTAGTCVVAANQGGSADYQAASQATQSIAISKGAQSISFGLAPALVVGGMGTLTATGGASGEAVIFSSTTRSICSVAGSTVTAIAVGDCVVAANQVADANYSAALQVTQTITVGHGFGLLTGWNLLGNATDQPLTVDAVFADTRVVTTAWKWDAAAKSWQFYTPTLDATGLQSYASSKGYAALTVINPGEGFWVNAKISGSLILPTTGLPYVLGAAQLKTGWNLVATADNITPATFNLSLSDSPPATGVVPPNLTSLWAWNNPQSKWYFYAPNFEAQGGTALLSYSLAKGYLDFTAEGKTLGNVGFWVNKP